VLVFLIGSPAFAGSISENFEISLHGTRQGKDTYYSNPMNAEGTMGGFYNLTQVPYDTLVCKDCHAKTLADGTPVDPETYEPTCYDCHTQIGSPVADSTCLGCHSRQKLEIMFFSDVHREQGLGCSDCHTLNEMHGDGNAYASLLEPGALEVNCEGCHPEDGLKPHKSHKHIASVDCTACHVQSVIACNSCHFESQLVDKKRFYAPPMRDFKMLVQNEGKIHSGSFQSLTFDGMTFNALAPFFSHTISAKGSDCKDCHLKGPKKDHANGMPKNAPLNEYINTGKIVVTRWDEATQLLIGRKGVIPVPPDWKDSLQFDFVTYDGDPSDPVVVDPSMWSFLKTGADLVDMPYGEPLSEEQMWHLINSR